MCRRSADGFAQDRSPFTVLVRLHYAQDDLSTVSPSDIRQFRDYQADRMSAVSANLSLKVVRIAFKNAIREHLIAENPAAKEFIARLRWTHIDLEHAEVSIFTEKTGRAQIIPIAAPLLRFMTQELPAHDDPAAPLFPRAHENVQRLILISSLRHLVKMNLPFVFTNQHAYPVMAEYYSDLEHLDQIDWEILQKRDFKHDLDDPGKKERYQAEALVYRYVPIEALLGIACFNGKVEATLKSEIDSRDLKLQVILKPSWYF